MAEKEEKQDLVSNKVPWRTIQAQLHGRAWRLSYLRAIWTRGEEAGGGILLHQESFPWVLPGEVKSWLCLAPLTDAGCLKGKQSTKMVEGSTGRALTSSATHPPPPQSNKSQHPNGSTSQVFPKLSHLFLPLVVPSLEYTWSPLSLIFYTIRIRVLPAALTSPNQTSRYSHKESLSDSLVTPQMCHACFLIKIQFLFADEKIEPQRSSWQSQNGLPWWFSW